MRPHLMVLLPVLIGLSGCAASIVPPAGPGPVGQPTGRWREQAHWIPVTQEDGSSRLLYASVCRPQTDAPARVVVLNHGTGVTRPAIRPSPCGETSIRWFLDRGYMLLQPIRRGFGPTGEPFNELSVRGPYAQSLIAAADIAAAVDYAASLPGARADHIAVVGVSTGGYASLAYSGRASPKVSAIVNVSGGRGSGFNRVSQADELIRAAGRFGATDTVPTLWVYATNDLFFSPDLVRGMWKAYTGAGGKAEYVDVGLFGYDGHALFNAWNGPPVWGPIVEPFLARH